jgi:CysZ protein
VFYKIFKTLKIMAFSSNNTPSVKTASGNPLRDFADGVFSYAKAWGIIRDYRLWSYVLVPGLVSIILGSAIAFFAYQTAGAFSLYITDLYPEEWFGYSIFTKIAGIFSWLILGFSGLLSFRILLMAIVAPFMSPLAARVQGIVSGKDVYDPPFFSFTNFRLILRGILLSLRNVMKELFYIIVLLILGLIPIFSPFVALLMFSVSAFYAGFGNLDYALEKYYGIRESKQFSRRHRWLAIGNGTVFLGLLAVPVLGLFFAPALSTVAATLETVKRVDAPLKDVQQLEQFI